MSGVSEADRIDAPKVLGRYRLLEELGRGSFGCVYKARHVIMDRTVAVKIILREFFEDSRVRKRFGREARALKELSHPNIVLAYDADEVDEQLFLVMEFVEGPNLHELVQSRGPLGIALACAMLQQAAKGLQHAHEKSLIHRDIKPANLLVPQSGLERWCMTATEPGQGGPILVKVGDFGLAQLPLHASATHHSRDKGFVGTPDFVSPEQARNLDVDIRSDLYSLGCTFYFALSGRTPFTGRYPIDVIVQHLERDATPLEALRPDVPVALASIVRRLMAKDPARRFQTPVELISELTFQFGSDRFGLSIPAQPADSRPPVQVSPAAAAVSEFDRMPATRIPSHPAAPVTENKQSVEPLVRDEPSAGTVEFTASPSAEDGQSQEGELPSPNSSATPAAAIALRRDEDFVLFWKEWRSVIERCCRGRPPGLDDSTYRALHAALLGRIRKLPEGAVPRARLEDVLLPWMSLEVLQTTDPATLASLLDAVYTLDRDLALASGHAGFWLTLAGLGAAVAAAMAAGFLLLSEH